MEDNNEALSILNFLQDGSFSLPPLEDAGKQIRLLEILPDIGIEGEICCTMKIGWLDDPDLRYTAISYTWGDPKPKKHIYIDGYPLQVTPNCWHALWQVKSNARPVGTFQQEQKLDHVYWIDAICINQEDVEEKTSQVAAMGNVYRNAVSVAACIGYESHDSPLFDEHFVRTWRTLAPSQRLHLSGTVFELIEQLLLRPWFTRLWTVQECILARNIQVFCGSRCVRWKMLRGQVKLTQNSYTRPPGFSQLDDFFKDSDLSQPSGNRPVFQISDLIQRYSTRKCAVLHDKVFGLISMVQEHTQGRIAVNYNTTLIELLWNYTEALSDYRVVNGAVEIKPDTPARGTWMQHSSISYLADSFAADPQFVQGLQDFWKWRAKMAVSLPWSFSRLSSGIYRELVSTIHCHRIDLETDRILSQEELLQWQMDCENSERAKTIKFWQEGRKIVAKPSVDVTKVTLKDSLESSFTRTIVVECSDDPKWPGEIHFLLPSSAQHGDFLVPTQNPANRGHFHLVCRPIPTESMQEMPLKAHIIGLAIRSSEPADSRAYMPWVRKRHAAEIFWRPYDIIARALLENTECQMLNLPILENEPHMASQLVLRLMTREEMGI